MVTTFFTSTLWFINEDGPASSLHVWPKKVKGSVICATPKRLSSGVQSPYSLLFISVGFGGLNSICIGVGLPTMVLKITKRLAVLFYFDFYCNVLYCGSEVCCNLKDLFMCGKMCVLTLSPMCGCFELNESSTMTYNRQKWQST